MNKKLNSFFTFSIPIARLWLSLILFLLIHFKLTSQTRPNEIKLADIEFKKYKNLDTSNKIKYIDSLYLQNRDLVRSNPDSALILANQIKDLSVHLDYEKGVLMANEAIARATIFKGFYDEGIQIALKILEPAKTIEAETLYLDCINVLGLGYFFKREIHKVYEYNQQGIAYAKMVGNKDREFVFSNNAGTLMANIGDFDKAIHFYNSCLKMLDKEQDSVSLAQVLNNMGSMYFEKGEYTKTREHLGKSIKISSIKNMVSWESDARITLGKVAINENNFLEAEKQFNISKTLLKDSKDFKQTIETNLGFAMLQLEKNSILDAEKTALKVLKDAKSVNFYKGIIESSKLLEVISEKQNKYKEAFYYLNAHTKLYDSLQFVKNSNKVRVMVLEKDLKSQQEITQIKLNQKLARQKLYMAIAIISILVLGIIIFLIRRTALIRKKLIKKLNIKTHEQEISQQKLVELNNTKNKLFSIIGHDLKGPIASLRDLLRLHDSGELKSKELVSFIPKITSSVNHLYVTLDNLLTWATTQMSGKTISPTNIDINELVTLNFALFQNKANNKIISLKNEVSPNTFVFADKDQIDIVLRNLISNALKFTKPEGSIIVKCHEENDFKIISVIDTGIGMEQQIADNLFKANTIVSTFGTQNEKGTGLGLQICKEMVELNKGSIWVESKLQNGTSFIFSLPKAEEN